MKPVVAVVEWFGPYSFDEARSAAFDYNDGIYCALGKTKYQRESRIQYVGLASNLRSRINGFHHALPLITRDQELWLGEVASPRTPGPEDQDHGSDARLGRVGSRLLPTGAAEHEEEGDPA